jgi:hypothetical protein
MAGISKYLRDEEVPGYAYYYNIPELETRFLGRNFVFRDFATFDLSLTEPHFYAEYLFFRHLGMPHKLAYHLFSNSCHWRGYSSVHGYSWRYRIKGRVRQTGDPHTSVGNNTIAIMTHVFMFAERYGIDNSLPSDWYKRCGCNWFGRLGWLKMLNNGDDNASESTIPQPDDRQYTAMGMAVTRSNSFCKLFPVVLAGAVRLVRNPVDFFTRLVHTRRYLDKELARLSLLHSNVVGASYFTSGVPVIWTWIERLWQLCKKAPLGSPEGLSNTMLQLFRSLSSPVFQVQERPTLEMRAAFAATFNLPPTDQLVLENYLRRVGLNDLLQHPTLLQWLGYCSRLDE